MKRREPQPALLGSLEEQVMLAVVRTGEEAYGMNVRREIEAVTGRDITIGSVYATLDRLEAKGLVGSARIAGADGAPPKSGAGQPAGSRRIFALTVAGVRSLSLTRETRERLWNGVRLERLSS